MELNNGIRTLETGDLARVAEVHLAAFPHSALTLLGKEAVRRYYEWLLTGPHEVTALGAFTGERLAGFCFGGRFRGAVAGFLRKNRGYLVWRTSTHFWLLTNPAFRVRAGFGVNLLKRFTRTRGVIDPITAVEPAPSFGILSIAVHPGFQGKGLGRLLMDRSEETARLLGFLKMNLTVETHNQQAIRFYESLGWKKTPANESWGGKMVKNLMLEREYR